MRKVKRQNYKGYEVLKFNKRGKLVHKYESMHVAQQEEKVGHKLLKRIIEEQRNLNGHKFRIGEKHGGTRTISSYSERAKWEGENGYFDIKGWSKSCL
jgi:hypothetical protein